MKKVLSIIAVVALSMSFTACGGDAADKKGGDSTANGGTAAATDVHHTPADFTDLDLTPAGISATMKAPKGATIKKLDDGTVIVQAGKFFQLSVSVLKETAGTDFIATVKEMAMDKDINPNFDKLAADEPNGILKQKKDGELDFTWTAESGNDCIIVSDGVPYGNAIDDFTDVPADDVKVMWESAKTITAK